jgi:hypothetical protein
MAPNAARNPIKNLNGLIGHADLSLKVIVRQSSPIHPGSAAVWRCAFISPRFVIRRDRRSGVRNQKLLDTRIDLLAGRYTAKLKPLRQAPNHPLDPVTPGDRQVL